jgi:hypothetical protein
MTTVRDIWVENLPVSRADIRAAGYIKPRSPEWYEARRGRLTASTRAHIILTGNDAAWEKLAKELERELSPEWEHIDHDNVYMKWGRDNEPNAIADLMQSLALASAGHFKMRDPGLILHPELDYCGSTPDGWINENVTVQIKCPYMQKNHLETLTTLRIKPEYRTQIQWEGWTSQREQIVFVSYDPRLDFPARLCILQEEADRNMWDMFGKLSIQFHDKFCQYLESGHWPRQGKLTVDSGIPELF